VITPPDDDDTPTPDEENDELDPAMEPAQIADQFPDDYDPADDDE